MQQPPPFSSFTKLAIILAVFGLPILAFFAWQARSDTTVNVSLTTNPDLENGLVGHWTFDGPDMNPNVRDRSGNGNHGVLAGFTSTTTRPGIIGQALEFDDGSSEDVNTTDIEAIDTSLTLSGCAWVYHYTIDDDDVMFGKWQLIGSNGIALHRDETGSQSGRTDTYKVAIGDSTDGDVAHLEGATNASKLNTWTHVCFTYEEGSTTGLRLYIDGVEDPNSPADVSGIGGHDGVNNFRIGSLATTGYFNGRMDDVRIYDRVLSEAEIKRLYELGATTHVNVTLNTNPALEAGLVGHWTFDGNLNTIMTDRSGNGNNAYFSTSTTATSSVVASGRIGQSIELDGLNEYVTVTPNSGIPVYSGSNYTASVAFWVKGPKQGPTALSGNHIYTEYRSGGAGSFLLATGPSGMCCGDQRDNLVIGLASTCCSLISTAWTTAVVFDDTWHHVVWTDNNGDGQMYIDGIADPPANGSWDYTPNGTHGNDTVYIGNDNAFKVFDGEIDDLRVYDRALSQEEVKRLYQLGATTHIGLHHLSPNTDLADGLVGYWTFDAGNNAQISDYSGNKNHGYFSGGATSSAITSGKIGAALDFDGTDDTVIANGIALADRTWSVSAWIKPDDTGQGNVFDFGNPFEGTRLALLNTDEVGFTYSGGNIHNTSNADLVAGQWYHVLGVIDGSAKTVSVYVDGVALIDNESDCCLNNNGETRDVYIGSRQQNPDGSYFDGVIDDVRFYDRALSADEVKRLYQLGAGN